MRTLKSIMKELSSKGEVHHYEPLCAPNRMVSTISREDAEIFLLEIDEGLNELHSLSEGDYAELGSDCYLLIVNNIYYFMD